ncbi:MAG TPA: hypothetical protein VI911_10650 [Patescibacteria group bacterium]|nr:hypothetical protein [Patescibacteria group bacterium]
MGYTFAWLLLCTGVILTVFTSVSIAKVFFVIGTAMLIANCIGTLQRLEMLIQVLKTYKIEVIDDKIQSEDKDKTSSSTGESA